MTCDAEHCYLSADDCRLADLIDLVNHKTDLADFPYSCTGEANVLVYDGARLRTELSRRATGRGWKPSWPGRCSTARASWCSGRVR